MEAVAGGIDVNEAPIIIESSLVCYLTNVGYATTETCHSILCVQLVSIPYTVNMYSSSVRRTTATVSHSRDGQTKALMDRRDDHF